MTFSPYRSRGPPFALDILHGVLVLLPIARIGKEWELLCIIWKQWEAMGKCRFPLLYLCTVFREKRTILRLTVQLKQPDY